MSAPTPSISSELKTILSRLRLGQMTEKGAGIAQSDSDAFRWYKLAADFGNAKGMLEVGQAYSTGMGVAVDHVAAVRWFQASAARGDVLAMESLATA